MPSRASLCSCIARCLASAGSGNAGEPCSALNTESSVALHRSRCAWPAASRQTLSPRALVLAPPRRRYGADVIVRPHLDASQTASLRERAKLRQGAGVPLRSPNMTLT